MKLTCMQARIDADRHVAAASISPSPTAESPASPEEIKISPVISETVLPTLIVDDAEEQSRLLVKISSLEVQLADTNSKLKRSDNSLRLTQQELHSSQNALKLEQNKTQTLEVQLKAVPKAHVEVSSDLALVC